MENIVQEELIATVEENEVSSQRLTGEYIQNARAKLIKEAQFGYLLKTNDTIFKEFLIRNLSLIRKTVYNVLKRYPFLIKDNGVFTFEDLVTEGIIAFYKAREKFQPELGIKFTTYAFYWVRGYIEEFLKKQLSIVSHTNDEVEEELLENVIYKDNGNIEEKIIQEELIEQAINRLTERQKTILDMYYYQGKTLAEIAQAMNCSLPTIVKELRRAKERMKRICNHTYNK